MSCLLPFSAKGLTAINEGTCNFVAASVSRDGHELSLYNIHGRGCWSWGSGFIVSGGTESITRVFRAVVVADFLVPHIWVVGPLSHCIENPGMYLGPQGQGRLLHVRDENEGGCECDEYEDEYLGRFCVKAVVVPVGGLGGSANAMEGISKGIA